MESKSKEDFISQKESLKKSLEEYKKSIKIDDITSPFSKMALVFWISCIIALIYSNFWIAILGYALSLILDYMFIAPTRKEVKNKIKLKEIEIKAKIDSLSEPARETVKSDIKDYISIEDNFDIKKDVVSAEEISVESLPPEKFFSNPRKIDWDAVNDKRKITGLKGEELVVVLEKNYLESIDREDLANKVRHMSVEKGDGSGYDVLSYSSDGQEKYIEVKSTSQASGSSFYISKNELNFLKNHTQDAFVYRLLNIRDDEEPLIKVYSADEVINSDQTSPVQYIVKME